MILAVDPGKTTGWATYDGLTPTFGEYSFENFHDHAHSWLLRSFTEGRSVRVVCERFVIMPSTATKSRGDTNWSIETIGVLRWLCRRFNFDFELQGASDAKRFGSDQLLRKVGWWTRGSDHARDAARHLLLAIARHDPSELDAILRSNGSGRTGQG